MLCNYCGKEVHTNAQVCQYCGKPFSTPTNDSDSNIIVFNHPRGTVEAIYYAPGQAVNRGDLLIHLNDGPQTFMRYFATLSGYVSRVFVSVGQTVQDGQALMEVRSNPVTTPATQPVSVPQPAPVAKPAPAPAPKAAAQPQRQPIPQPAAQPKNASQQPRENVLMGILGAVLGAGAVGLVLAYLTYHGAFGTQFGFLLPCLALLGYQKFGKKISFFTFVVVIVLTAVTPYLADRAAWAWSLMENGWANSFFDAFKMVPDQIGNAISRSAYKSDLETLYIFCIAGIVLPVLSFLWNLLKELLSRAFRKKS